MNSMRVRLKETCGAAKSLVTIYRNFMEQMYLKKQSGLKYKNMSLAVWRVSKTWWRIERIALNFWAMIS